MIDEDTTKLVQPNKNIYDVPSLIFNSCLVEYSLEITDSEIDFLSSDL
jgi:hypothetical protein